jgi:dihydropyrimidinase
VVQTPILLVQISDTGATKCIREAQTRGQPVFAETCPQYLFLTREEHLNTPYGFEAAKHVSSPPPRDKTAQAVIWTGLRNGTFTVLSSDHCTFNFNDDVTGKKTRISEEFPVGRFRYISNGLPSVEARLPIAFAATHRLDRLPLTKLVEVTSTNAAKLYGLYPKKGAMIPSLSDAVLVI